ncbi:hypothetical protein HK405_007658, partial [Cladochytrium tenue]
TVTEDDVVDTDGSSSNTSPMSSNVSGQRGAAAAQQCVLKYTNSSLVRLSDSINSHLHFNSTVGLVVCTSCGIGLPYGGESGRLQCVHGVSTSRPTAQAAIRSAVDTCCVTAGIVDDAQVTALCAPYMQGQDKPAAHRSAQLPQRGCAADLWLDWLEIYPEVSLSIDSLKNQSVHGHAIFSVQIGLTDSVV